ncbi:hypothetical protein U27_07084 [Candidatus Vecturithrix granuli]|uniref:Uncharacterized protein n=1 Tax=Vecturithrix granuli TaxID=1499967 RepID=A0A081C691_VECG1|nr:hypothetical protein U27_07084 [Candidatus Vecturithrix granuli]
MLTLEGIFDGQHIEVLGSIPFHQKKRVLITFLDDTLFPPKPSADIDPISALRGRDKHAHLTEKLLAARKEEQVWKAH